LLIYRDVKIYVVASRVLEITTDAPLIIIITTLCHAEKKKLKRWLHSFRFHLHRKNWGFAKPKCM